MLTMFLDKLRGFLCEMSCSSGNINYCESYPSDNDLISHK